MHKSICKAQSTRLASDMRRNQRQTAACTVLLHTQTHSPLMLKKKAFDLKQLEATVFSDVN